MASISDDDMICLILAYVMNHGTSKLVYCVYRSVVGTFEMCPSCGPSD